MMLHDINNMMTIILDIGEMCSMIAFSLSVLLFLVLSLVTVMTNSSCLFLPSLPSCYIVFSISCCCCYSV